jgi:hypothetical protein
MEKQMEAPPRWAEQKLKRDMLGLRREGLAGSELQLLAGVPGGPLVRLDPTQLQEFIRVHDGSQFSFDDSLTVLAEMMIWAEQNQQALVGVLWKLVRDHRIIDLRLARTLIRMADSSIPFVGPAFDFLPMGERFLVEGWAVDNPRDIAMLGQYILQRLTSLAIEHSAHTLPRFGPLSLSLQIGAGIAFALTEFRGVQFPEDSQKELKAQCVERFNNLAEHFRNRQPFNKLRGKEINVGLKELWSDKSENWIDEQRSSIRDYRGVVLNSFLDSRNLLPDSRFEDWPEWALAVPSSPQFAAMRRICQLHTYLEQLHEEELRHHHEILPRLRARPFDLGALDGAQLPRVIRPRKGYVLVRVEIPHLRARALVELLRDTPHQSQGLRQAIIDGLDPADWPRTSQNQPRTPPSEEDRQVARAVLRLAPLGIWCDGLADLVEIETGVKRSGGELRSIVKRIPEIGDYLADRSWELLSERLSLKPEDLRARFPKASPRLIAENCMDPKVWMKQTEEFNLRAFMRETDNAFGEKQLGTSSGPAMYRWLFGETITGRSGWVRSGLLWVAARSEAIIGLADDVLKSVAFDLAENGYGVTGIEPEGLVVEVPFDPCVNPETRIRQLVAGAANELLTEVPIECLVHVHFEGMA